MGRLGAAALAACLVLALVGCESEPEPRFADPTSEPTAVETSEVTTPPTSPPSTPVTVEPEPLGPEETVRAWVKAYNALITSGEAGPIQEVSTEACPQCADLVTNFVGLYADGGSLKTNGWKIERLKRRPDFGQSGQVAASIISNKSTIVRQPGGDPEFEAKETFFVQWILVKRQGRWLVNELAFVS